MQIKPFLFGFIPIPFVSCARPKEEGVCLIRRRQSKNAHEINGIGINTRGESFMYVNFWDQFYSRAQSLRDEFDQRFADPYQATAERFVWDYWHIPKEYTVLRTPAYEYFSKRRYEHFHRYLVDWGRAHLGCHDVSPPWLSCYVEGCRQFPHRDVPHGPLAFVFSLTPWSRNRKFTGGETFLKSPRQLIEPKFNRLTVFDPSTLHGVREVRGTHDPRFGRLVIHGWFVNPRPFWEGPLKVEDVQETLDQGLSANKWAKVRGSGFVSLRLKIQASGQVSAVKVLVNTLDGSPTPKWLSVIEQFRFASRKKGSTLTLPLLFQ